MAVPLTEVGVLVPRDYQGIGCGTRSREACGLFAVHHGKLSHRLNVDFSLPVSYASVQRDLLCLALTCMHEVDEGVLSSTRQTLPRHCSA